MFIFSVSAKVRSFWSCEKKIAWKFFCFPVSKLSRKRGFRIEYRGSSIEDRVSRIEYRGSSIEDRVTFKLPSTVLNGIVGERFWLCHYKIYLILPSGCQIFSWSPPTWQIIGSQLLWSRLYTQTMTDPPSVLPWKPCDPPKIIQPPPSPGDNK